MQIGVAADGKLMPELALHNMDGVCMHMSDWLSPLQPWHHPAGARLGQQGAHRSFTDI